MEQVTVAIVGAGLRGQRYAQRAVATGRCRVVAVAEPQAVRRDRLAGEYGILPERRFAGWAELAARGRIADAVIIATQDTLHLEPAVALLDLDYHVLLEKPMAPTEIEARQIVDAVERAQRRVGGKLVFGVCHVLRYTPYTTQLVGRLRCSP
jgi:predicted dehydrogenase